MIKEGFVRLLRMHKLFYEVEVVMRGLHGKDLTEFEKFQGNCIVVVWCESPPI